MRRIKESVMKKDLSSSSALNALKTQSSKKAQFYFDPILCPSKPVLLTKALHAKAFMLAPSSSFSNWD